MFLDNRIAGHWGQFFMELPMRCSFLEGLFWLIAVLNEYDWRVGLASCVHKRTGIADELSCSINWWAADSVKSAALNVNDEESSGVHGFREPNVVVQPLAEGAARSASA